MAFDIDAAARQALLTLDNEAAHRLSGEPQTNRVSLSPEQAFAQL